MTELHLINPAHVVTLTEVGKPDYFVIAGQRACSVFPQPYLDLSARRICFCRSTSNFSHSSRSDFTFLRLVFFAADLALSKASASLRLNLYWSSLAFLLNLSTSQNFSSLVSFIGSSAKASLARLI